MEFYFASVWIAMVIDCLLLNGSDALTPPADLGRPHEITTNLSLDALITKAIGGIEVASNMFFADDRHILAELDMVLSKEQFLELYQPPSPEQMEQMDAKPENLAHNYVHATKFSEDFKGSGIRTRRKAAKDPRLRWTQGILPYQFAENHFDNKEEYLMRRSMTEWERYTCLNFRPATGSDKNSVRFQNGAGCNSQLGMIGGVQTLNLQAPGCRYKGLYLHEIGHAIGLVHEHQLPDRDQHIRILYHNVEAQMRIWFNKYDPDRVHQMGVPYELSSVMHYGITAFAFDGYSQTIEAIDKSQEKTIGEVYLKELSYTDVHIVNLMYNCSSHCPNQNQCGPEGHLDQNCRCICRDGSSDCDTTRQTKPANCANNYYDWACYIWANQGECERNPHYMKQECAKACQVCGVSPAQGGCKDVYSQTKCQVWKDRGDCVTNQRWMTSYCPATCNLCGDVENRKEANCQNKHADQNKCREWALDGECVVNPVFMFENCRKSCALCDAKETPFIGTGEEGGDEDSTTCENTNSNCQKWADSGECDNNPTWMIPNCRESCGKCDDGTCKNLYEDTQCEIWAQKFECVSNSDWMGKHCAKSCGRGLCEGTKPTGQTSTSKTGVRTPTTSKTTAGLGQKTTPSLSSKTTHASISTTAPCKNLHTSDTECEVWAKHNHCSVNPGWMLRHCARSCQVGCGGGQGQITTQASGGGIKDSCVDDDAKCESWAEHGNCDSNPTRTLRHCRKACDNCKGCRDTNVLCKVWAEGDGCDKNPRYMLRNCQLSCDVCPRLQRDSENGGRLRLSLATQTLLMLLLCNFMSVV